MVSTGVYVFICPTLAARKDDRTSNVLFNSFLETHSCVVCCWNLGSVFNKMCGNSTHKANNDPISQFNIKQN